MIQFLMTESNQIVLFLNPQILDFHLRLNLKNLDIHSICINERGFIVHLKICIMFKRLHQKGYFFFFEIIIRARLLQRNIFERCIRKREKCFKFIIYAFIFGLSSKLASNLKVFTDYKFEHLNWNKRYNFSWLGYCHKHTQFSRNISN